MVLSPSSIKKVEIFSVVCRNCIMASSTASKKKDKRTTLLDFDLTTTLGKHRRTNCEFRDLSYNSKNSLSLMMSFVLRIMEVFQK